MRPGLAFQLGDEIPGLPEGDRVADRVDAQPEVAAKVPPERGLVLLDQFEERDASPTEASFFSLNAVKNPSTILGMSSRASSSSS